MCVCAARVWWGGAVGGRHTEKKKKRFGQARRGRSPPNLIFIFLVFDHKRQTMPLSARAASLSGRGRPATGRQPRPRAPCRAAPEGGSVAPPATAPPSAAPPPAKAGPAFLSDLLSFEVSAVRKKKKEGAAGWVEWNIECISSMVGGRGRRASPPAERKKGERAGGRHIWEATPRPARAPSHQPALSLSPCNQNSPRPARPSRPPPAPTSSSAGRYVNAQRPGRCGE